jgi:hypothetical protein
VFAGTLAGERGEAPLALTWDPVERTGEPVRCGRCDGLTYEVASTAPAALPVRGASTPETGRTEGTASASRSIRCDTGSLPALGGTVDTAAGQQPT